MESSGRASAGASASVTRGLGCWSAARRWRTAPAASSTRDGAWTVLGALAHNPLRSTQLFGLPNSTVRAGRTITPMAADRRAANLPRPRLDRASPRPMAMARRLITSAPWPGSERYRPRGPVADTLNDPQHPRRQRRGSPAGKNPPNAVPRDRPHPDRPPRPPSSRRHHPVPSQNLAFSRVRRWIRASSPLRSHGSSTVAQAGRPSPWRLNMDA